MTARVVQQLPEGDDWLYEVKFDGYRALILKNGGHIQIRSRNQKDLTAAYRSIVSAAARLNAKTAVLDGEVVAVDGTGHPSFQALQHRAAHPNHTIVFYAFDVLHLNGEDLTALPLEKRKSRLPSIVEGSGILLSHSLPGTAAQVIDAVNRLGLEGVIAKRKDSRYSAGLRTDAWVKLKLDKQQEFVIGGYRPGAHRVDAILVGYHEGRSLRFAGKVRARRRALKPLPIVLAIACPNSAVDQAGPVLFDRAARETTQPDRRLTSLSTRKRRSPEVRRAHTWSCGQSCW